MQDLAKNFLSLVDLKCSFRKLVVTYCFLYRFESLQMLRCALSAKSKYMLKYPFACLYLYIETETADFKKLTILPNEFLQAETSFRLICKLMNLIN